MGCMGCGSGGGSSKSSNHSTKKPPNWGMTSKPYGGSKKINHGSTGFGTPKVKMSFSGRNRGNY